MARFEKLSGGHTRRENGVLVKYRKGDVIEATAEELRRVDPELKTWKRLEDFASVAKETFEKATGIKEEVKGDAVQEEAGGGEAEEVVAKETAEPEKTEEPKKPEVKKAVKTTSKVSRGR